MHLRWATLYLCAFGALAQQTPTDELIRIARNGGSAALAAAIAKEYPKLKESGAAAASGPDFLFVAATARLCSLSLNGRPPEPMTRLEGSPYCYTLRKMRTGTTYAYEFFGGGASLGAQRDLPSYNPDSYERPGVPKGKLSEKFTITSRIYDGMKADWWVWASPGVDPAKPTALMVWQDGQGLATGQGGQVRLFTVVENLIEQKLLPPMVHVLIAPGFDANGRAMRATEYDTVSDRYGRFLMEEVLPEAEKLYTLRQDGYSRAIGGTSSGAICSFNVAWHFPERFARVHSTIGSYTSIQ